MDMNVWNKIVEDSAKEAKKRLIQDTEDLAIHGRLFDENEADERSAAYNSIGMPLESPRKAADAFK